MTGAIIAILIVSSIGGIFYLTHSNKRVPQGSRAIINDTVFNIEVASSVIAQAHGLSERESLDEDAGMLFVFNNEIERTFWMKRMKFPLDIVWVRDMKIIGVSKNAVPEGAFPTTVYTSPEPVDMVLEINGGLFDIHTINVGDTITIKPAS